MRIGQNPAKSMDHLSLPGRVTVAVVTYIPFLHGYFSQSLEVLKVCLDSIRENTGARKSENDHPLYDLMVFDNASCSEVRAYLLEKHKQGQIQYLTLSDKNVGKGGAWNMIFQSAPGEIIAYSDSDVYYHKGWLDRSLEILKNYPRVGMVTARPLRTPEEFLSSTLEWAQSTSDVVIQEGRSIGWEIFKEHTDSLGMSEEEAKARFEVMPDWKISYQGISCYAGAAHFQFVGYTETLRQMFPIEMDRPMGQVRSLDIKLNQQGYLRLATSEAHIRHIGNRLNVKNDLEVVSKQSALPFAKRLLSQPVIRKPLLYLYELIFRLYYENS